MTIIANVYWPFTNDPKMSRVMVSNVSEGVGCDIKLCQSFDGVIDLQGVYNRNTVVVILSMFWKNTLDVSSALVFVSPKCRA